MKNPREAGKKKPPEGGLLRKYESGQFVAHTLKSALHRNAFTADS